jgi:hypothetical protein
MTRWLAIVWRRGFASSYFALVVEDPSAEKRVS